MALRTKTMTASEAKKMRQIHEEMSHAFGGSSSADNMKTVVGTVGVSLITKFIGAISGTAAAVGQVLFNIANNANNEANRSYLAGAAKGFDEIEALIRDGGHSSAEVQQVWISYSYGGNDSEFVQGNEQNPSKAYKIISYN